MIWIETQRKELFYCSAIKVDIVTPSQVVLRNQTNDVLGEYNTLDRAIEVMSRIKTFISCDSAKIFTMPMKFE